MSVLLTLLALAYPALLYLVLGVTSPRVVALAALAVLGLRLAFLAPNPVAEYARLGTIPAIAFSAAILASFLWNNEFMLLLAPALVSFALLLGFGLSFLQHETVVESLARVQVGTLTDSETAYCRRVTALWCAFFLLNGAIASELAWAGRPEMWALYTGCIAYILVGLLFASEFVYRQWRFRRYLGGPTDFLFRRLFPPHSS